MNITKTTSQHPRDLDLRMHPLARGKKMFLATSLIALSCLTFSSAWAGGYTHSKTTSAPIHLTGLSIHIGPGGFHVGIGALSHGRAYARPHLHGRFGHQRHWKHSRHFGHRHNYAAPKRFGHRHHFASPKRFGHGHGWKNDRHRGHFRGKGGRGNGRHRGGRW